MSTSIGQDCNAALEVVAIVDTLLDEYADDWAEAIALPQAPVGQLIELWVHGKSTHT